MTLAQILAVLLPPLVEQAVKLLKAHEEGKLTDDEVRAEIAKMRASVVAQDAMIDARIDAAG